MSLSYEGVTVASAEHSDRVFIFSDDYPSSLVIHKSEVWKDGNGDGVSVIDAGDKV
jgi:hypothetical protein